MRICVDAWVQCLFPLIVIDDVNFASPDNKVCGWNCLGFVLLLITGNNGSFTQACIGEAGNEPNGILI